MNKRGCYVDCLKDAKAIIESWLNPTGQINSTGKYNLRIVRCIALLVREIEQLRDRVHALEDKEKLCD